jgi:hypothetical protein
MPLQQCLSIAWSILRGVYADRSSGSAGRLRSGSVPVPGRGRSYRRAPAGCRNQHLGSPLLPLHILYCETAGLFAAANRDLDGRATCGETGE